MKHRCIAALACALVAIPFTARAQDAPIVAQVQAAADNQCALLLAGRVDLYADTMDDSFVDTDPAGNKSTKPTVVAHAQELQAVLKLQTCKATVFSASRSGDTITAKLRQDITGQALTKSGWQPLRMVGDSTDSFVERNGTLLESASVDQWSQFWLNGKVVQHQGTVPASAP